LSVYPGYPVSVVKENGPFSLAAVVFFAWNFKCYISDNSYSRLIFFFGKGERAMQSNMSCIMWADKRQKNEESIRKGWMQFLLFRCKN